MARLNWEGSTFNNASVEDIYLEDVNGEQFGFLNCLGGDITITPAKIGRFSSMVRGFVQSRLQGEVEAGSIAIPLKVRWLTANGGSSNPSLLDILAQNDNRGPYRPWTAVPVPASGDLPARTIYADVSVKTWKIVIVVNTASIDGAPYKSKFTCYPMIPTVDHVVANVGADSTTTINGTIDDPALGVWGPV